MNGPYTRKPMEDARGATGDSRFDGLHAEASAAVAYSANTLREVREHYRAAYADALVRWQELRDELDGIEREPRTNRPRLVPDSPAAVAEHAAPGVIDAHRRALRSQVDALAEELEGHRSALARLELAERTLSRTWLFLERGDTTLIAAGEGPDTDGDIAMRIVEAQEAERARLAQEIHDGPAQALSKAIFQADYAERVSTTDLAAAAAEIGSLRDLLRRELDNLRGFISQLRPPLLDELGLDGAIMDTIQHTQAVTGLLIAAELNAPPDRISDGQQTVVLRVAQEALQNIRKHAAASHVIVTTRLDGGDWVLEVSDDGRGFDSQTVAARGRRNFGLQFMRERAELIGARIDIRSRPDGGTVVRLAIPTAPAPGGEESR
jgi:two-component system, NarL family, sensor histidine kinase DegS